MSFTSFVISFFSSFNEESIKAYFAGAQNYPKECALIACRNIYKIKLKVFTFKL
jgi:hypothetical protein